MKTLKIQVRIDSTDSGKERLIAFLRENGQLCCFTWFDGHNAACDEYRLSLPVAWSAEAAEFVESMQRYYDSLPGKRVRLELAQRLARK